MTISSTSRKSGPYAGNDTATDFPFDFKVFSASDLLVVRADASGDETALILDTDYTVTLNTNQDANPGGTVALPAALATGFSLVITSDMENLQPAELTNNGGFYPKVINTALDRLTILVQQVAEQVGRAVKTPISSGMTPDELLESIATADSDAAAAAAVAQASAASAAGSASSAFASSSAAAVSAENAGNTAATLAEKLDEFPSTAGFASFAAALAQASGRILVNTNQTIAGTHEVTSQQLAGIATDRTTITQTTALTTDYGLHCNDYAELSRLAINHTCNATGTINGRSNCAILLGAKLSSDDTASKGARIEGVKVSYTDTATFAGNTVAGFGNVSKVTINGLEVETNNGTGLQFHWGYNAASTRTNHPREIDIENYSVSGNTARTTGLYLSGCHDIRATGGVIRNCNQGIIIGAGDVGEGRSPADESIGKVMGNIVIESYTLDNVLNDAILANGASYVLGATVDPAFPNQRWIAADQNNTGLTFRDVRIIRDTASSNNPVSLLHLRNTEIDNLEVGLKGSAQATDTTEALSLTACTDSRIDIGSNCVVSVNGLSGKNNHLHVRHDNTDTANTTSQNAVVIRGSIVNATVRDAVNIGDTFIVLTLTAEIHKGMLFEYGGTVFEFAGHARLDSTGANNIGVKVPIVAAPAAIPAGATIAQYYCMQDTKITGKIVGANKGVRIISSDARVPFGIDIDADFEKCITNDIEVPVGITIRYKGKFYRNDNGATMTFKDGVALQTTVISWDVINGKRIGNSAAIPTSGTWAKGDVLYNRNAAAGGSPGWVCTTAGTPGTWKAMPNVAA